MLTVHSPALNPSSPKSASCCHAARFLFSLMLLVFAVFSITTAVQAAPMTYELSFDDGGGNTLTGAITLNDGVLGPASSTDILSWSFAAASDAFPRAAAPSAAVLMLLGLFGCVARRRH